VLNSGFSFVWNCKLKILERRSTAPVEVRFNSVLICVKILQNYLKFNMYVSQTSFANCYKWIVLKSKYKYEWTQLFIHN
jgi:hypothetical protein